MNLEKSDSIKNLDADNEVPSDNPNLQRVPSGAELSRNPTVNSIQPQQQFLQVTQKTQMHLGTQEDFQRIMRQMLAKKQLQPIYEPSFKRRGSLQKKQQVYISPEQQEKERILQSIEHYVKSYKALNNPNSSDSQVTKLRAEAKQKIFRALLYGIQQIKLRKQEQLNEEQRKIAKLTAKDPYILAKNITAQIDISFFKFLNKENRQTTDRKYRTFMRNFTFSLIQYTNSKLRRRILTRQLSAKQMATMHQQQFYPDHMKRKLQQKNQLFLKDLEMLPTPHPVVQQPQISYSLSKPQYDQQKKQQKPKYKYAQKSTLLMLRDFLKPQQIKRMRNTVLSDLRKDIQVRLLANFDKVFETQV